MLKSFLHFLYIILSLFNRLLQFPIFLRIRSDLLCLPFLAFIDDLLETEQVPSKHNLMGPASFGPEAVPKSLPDFKVELFVEVGSRFAQTLDVAQFLSYLKDMGVNRDTIVTVEREKSNAISHLVSYSLECDQLFSDLFQRFPSEPLEPLFSSFLFNHLHTLYDEFRSIAKA